MCVVCAGTAATVLVLGTSAVIGTAMGIRPPESNKAKFINLTASLSLTAITSFALKVLFDISVLGNYGFSLQGITLMMLWTTPMTIIYSIAVNFLLNRFWSEKKCQGHTICSHCSKV